MFDDIAYHGEVDFVVAVDEDVSESDHPAEGIREPRFDRAGALQQPEKFRARSRFTEMFVRDDVRRDVECRLDSDLQCVFDEPLLSHVLTERGRAREAAEIGHTRLDHGELLRNELGIGQRSSRGMR